MKGKNIDASKATLKDIDFMKMEGKLRIGGMSGRVRSALLRDAEFFKRMKLMDYSLLVMKINWKNKVFKLIF